MKFSSVLAAVLLGLECAYASPAQLVARRLVSRTSNSTRFRGQPKLPPPVVDGAFRAATSTNAVQGQQLDYSSNWSGAVVYGTDLESVVATLTVPEPTIPPGGNASCYYGASAWVGFDGYNECTNAILQVGITIILDSGQPSYVAWFEWYPDAAYNFAGFAIHAGDVITLSATANGTAGGAVVVENETTGQAVQHTFAGETTTLCRGTAEFIVEDYMRGNDLVDFVDYGRLTFANAVTTQADGKTVGVANATLVAIVDDGGIASNCTTAGDSIVDCQWLPN